MLRASSQAICVPRPRLKPVQTFLGFGFYRFFGCDYDVILFWNVPLYNSYPILHQPADVAKIKKSSAKPTSNNGIPLSPTILHLFAPFVFCQSQHTRKNLGFRTHPRPMLALAGMFSEAVPQGQHWASASVVQASESMMFFGLVLFQGFLNMEICNGRTIIWKFGKQVKQLCSRILRATYHSSVWGAWPRNHVEDNAKIWQLNTAFFNVFVVFLLAWLQWSTHALSKRLIKFIPGVFGAPGFPLQSHLVVAHWSFLGFVKGRKFQICIGLCWIHLLFEASSNSMTVCSASSVQQYDGREKRRGDVCCAPTQGHGQHQCFLHYWQYLRFFFAN